jgi:uncharacterized protein YidB (DUF937 family)
MSWSDALKGSLGTLIGQVEQSALPAIMNQALGQEGLQTILAKLQQGGMAEHVQSWLDQNRQNLPISTDQLRTALGNQHVQQLAQSLGLPVDKLLSVLAQHLPEAASTAGAQPGGDPGDGKAT